MKLCDEEKRCENGRETAIRETAESYMLICYIENKHTVVTT